VVTDDLLLLAPAQANILIIDFGHISWSPIPWPPNTWSPKGMWCKKWAGTGKSLVRGNGWHKHWVGKKILLVQRTTAEIISILGIRDIF
jgi:hypothetical protein